MEKLLIDCGSNLGQGFEELQIKLNIDSSWKIVMFEPNKNCIFELEKRYTNSNISILNKAVYTYDGKINFNIPQNDSISVSSTIHDNTHNTKYDVKYHSPLEVECVDLSKFVIDSCDNFEVYLKLDVEGSELEILEKMIQDLSHLKIKKLFVEFHDQYVDDNLNSILRLSERKKVIIDRFFSDKIELEIWK